MGMIALYADDGYDQKQEEWMSVGQIRVVVLYLQTHPEHETYTATGPRIPNLH